MAAITKTELPLSLLASGKVRDVYELPDSDNLLFVATDRVSCFDVVLSNGIPSKGSILTSLSEFWFQLLSTKIPTLQTHFISLGLPAFLQLEIPPSLKPQLQRRSMVVRRLEVLKIESIVRGYITGSAWSSYRKDGTVCGIRLRDGLMESERLEKPLWTPSTKAAAGEKDENISPEEAANLIGKDYALQIENLSLSIYDLASHYARGQGIIIADTKLEFGLDKSTSPPSVVLIDEVLTPDSSRFWSAAKYEVGKPQESLDKQFVRDWLIKEGLKGKEGVELPEHVIEMTGGRYRNAFRMLVGKEWEEEVAAGENS